MGRFQTKKGPVFMVSGWYMGSIAWVAETYFLRNSVSLQPSLHCSWTGFEAHFHGASPKGPPFKPLSL